MVLKYLDTYALCEIARGNVRFAQYTTEEFIINDLTLAEFYGVILREHGEELAQHWLNKLKPYSQSVQPKLLTCAVTFKIQHAKKNLSFFDAVGYVCALENKALFVTGDKEFEKLKGVEFVKKE